MIEVGTQQLRRLGQFSHMSLTVIHICRFLRIVLLAKVSFWFPMKYQPNTGAESHLERTMGMPQNRKPLRCLASFWFPCNMVRRGAGVLYCLSVLGPPKKESTHVAFLLVSLYSEPT